MSEKPFYRNSRKQYQFNKSLKNQAIPQEKLLSIFLLNVLRIIFLPKKSSELFVAISFR